MPEVLHSVFTCLTGIIRTLAKRLAAAIPALLKCSRKLRFHRLEHIRNLAAHAFAFPLRHASDKQLDKAVHGIFAGVVCMLWPEMVSRQMGPAIVLGSTGLQVPGSPQVMSA